MLERVEGESLYSVIYRTHVLYGISDFSNILNHSGLFRYRPTLLKGTIKLFEPIDEKEIKDYLLEMKWISSSKSLFTSPTAFIEELRLFLYGYRPNMLPWTKKNHEIKYCLDCIKENIQKNGFSVHKQVWIGNDYCHVHDIPLFYCKPEERNRSIKNLKRIFSGTHPDNYQVTQSSLKLAREFDFEYFTDNDTGGGLYFAPCLERYLKKLSPALGIDFPEIIEKSIETNFQIEFNLDNAKELSNDLDYSIRHMINGGADLKLLLKKIKNSKKKISHVTLRKGVINPNKFVFKIYKKKSRNCITCKSKMCPVNS